VESKTELGELLQLLKNHNSMVVLAEVAFAVVDKQEIFPFQWVFNWPYYVHLVS
jgi:hypothetical protein